VITAALLILGIGRLAFGLSMEAQVAWLLALIALSVVVPGVFGNAWLYNASRKKMEKALTVNATLADACAMLRRRAASRQRLIGLAIGNGVLLAGVAGLSFSFLNMQRPAAVQSPAPASSQASVPSPASSAIAAASAPAAVTATSAPVSIATSAPIAASAAASAPEMKQVSAPPTSAASAASTASAPHAPAAVTEPGKEAINKKRTDTKPATPAPAVSTPAKTKPKTEKVPVNESKSSSVPEHKFIVNVGLFADDNNARNAAAKLQDAGIAVLVNEIDTAKGKRTRVRAGPFASQAEAERAVDKIQFIGLDAVVVRK
jgi:cell division protein FtsN